MGPIKIFKVNGVQASVFINQREGANGSWESVSVNIHKNYVDEQGKWQTTNSFNAGDLLKAIYVLQKAADYALNREGEPKSEAKKPEKKGKKEATLV